MNFAAYLDQMKFLDELERKVFRLGVFQLRHQHVRGLLNYLNVLFSDYTVSRTIQTLTFRKRHKGCAYRKESSIEKVSRRPTDAGLERCE